MVFYSILNILENNTAVNSLWNCAVLVFTFLHVPTFMVYCDTNIADFLVSDQCNFLPAC